jgi:hypothetical protein
MSERKEQQQADEQIAEDLTVPQAQAEEVGGGTENITFDYGKLAVKYEPQKP